MTNSGTRTEIVRTFPVYDSRSSKPGCGDFWLFVRTWAHNLVLGSSKVLLKPQPTQHPPEAACDPEDPSQGSIERLFREHNEALVGFLMARLKSRQAAQEVAQEAYVRLLSLDQPGAISYLRAFLFRTAANLAIDRLRRDQVHARATGAPLFAELTDARTPERQVASEQQLQVVQEALAQLPPKCREAFLLARIDEKSCAEIATQMGVSERMVRFHIVRALLFCRAKLNGEKCPSERGHG
jgi:RNA polymerase sigma factor (sigma-70 family)